MFLGYDLYLFIFRFMYLVVCNILLFVVIVVNIVDEYGV